VTTRNKRKADRLAHAYDDLEQRIGVIMEQEQLNALRPDLSGEDIMRILDLKPSKQVGEAYAFLMELRLEEGPIGAEEAEKRLLAWWANR
jgi:poly(A) polymerase